MTDWLNFEQRVDLSLIRPTAPTTPCSAAPPRPSPRGTHSNGIASDELARNQHPGQRNTLDALCKRYHVDNSQRELHGALLDAEILADVYLAMTGGQVGLGLDDSLGMDAESATAIRRLATDRPPLPIIAVGDRERSEHEAYLDRLDQAVGGACVWRR